MTGKLCCNLMFNCCYTAKIDWCLRLWTGSYCMRLAFSSVMRDNHWSVCRRSALDCLLCDVLNDHQQAPVASVTGGRVTSKNELITSTRSRHPSHWAGVPVTSAEYMSKLDVSVQLLTCNMPSIEWTHSLLHNHSRQSIQNSKYTVSPKNVQCVTCCSFEYEICYKTHIMMFTTLSVCHCTISGN